MVPCILLPEPVIAETFEPERRLSLKQLRTRGYLRELTEEDIIVAEGEERPGHTG